MLAEIEKAVQLLKDGNDARVDQALALLQDTVFSFSMRVCGHREDAEDTMQEVLLKSVPQLPKFDALKHLSFGSTKCEEPLPDESSQEQICSDTRALGWMN